MANEIRSERNADRLITTVRQVGGGTRYIYAQSTQHARRGRSILRSDRAMIDRLNGVDGISITVVER